MAKLYQIELNHYCHIPGGEGKPGDVVTVDQVLRDQLVALKGAASEPMEMPGGSGKSKPKPRPSRNKSRGKK